MDSQGRNENDAISMAQPAEGALQESANILRRMRELAIQARNDSSGTADQTATNTEFAQLSDELTRMSAPTNFDGQNLLDGSANTMTLQMGSNTSTASDIDLTLNSTLYIDSLQVGSRTHVSTGPAGDGSSSNIDNAITAIDAAIA